MKSKRWFEGEWDREGFYVLMYWKLIVDKGA